MVPYFCSANSFVHDVGLHCSCPYSRRPASRDLCPWMTDGKKTDGNTYPELKLDDVGKDKNIVM